MDDEEEAPVIPGHEGLGSGQRRHKGSLGQSCSGAF